MKTRNLIFTALTALALAALTGCSSETEFPQEISDVIPEGMTRVEFTIKGVKTGSSYAASPTVALEPIERQINDVTAYLFKMSPIQADIAPSDHIVEVIETNLNNGKASFLMPNVLQDERYDVVLIANKACYNATALNAVVKGSTFNDLNTVETIQNTSIMTNLLQKGLPMRALTTISIPAGGGKVGVDATFTRPLSRFDIDNQAVHSFNITSVVLNNGRTTAALNMPIQGAPEVMAQGGVANVEYSTFISDVNERLTPPHLNADGSNTKLRPAFYASPGLDADNTSLLVRGEVRSELDYYPAEYEVPLVNKSTGERIVISANKRYRVTLSMDKDGNIVGEVSLDLGQWEDNDPTGSDVNPDLSYQVADINPTTVTYEVETRTFTLPNNVLSFRFEMMNDLGIAPVISGNDIITSVGKVSSINSRAVKVTSYEVTLKGNSGTGSFSFTTKDAKVYVFNVVAVIPPTIPYPGFTEPAILMGDIYWAPANIGATTVDEPGTIFQYGRSVGWASVQEMIDSKVPSWTYGTITWNDSETTYAGKALIYDASWWGMGTLSADIQAMLDNWAGISNGSKNPCPAGWRLPTFDEAWAIGLLTASGSETVSPGVVKVTVEGIPFICKEYYDSRTDEIFTDLSVYWARLNVANLASFKVTAAGNIEQASSIHDTGGSDGRYLRCVKDAVLVP